jgi:hypothetical protein
MVDPDQPALAPDQPAGQTLSVRFQGTGTGTAPLSWGQRELWHVMEQKRVWLPIGTALPLPAGTTVAQAVADLRFVMGRYPSLRTRLRFDPDGPKQVVSGSGEIPLEIVDAPDDADPAEVAEQVRKRYWNRDYDFVSEWPLRMAVIRHRGALTHRVWVMCHLVTDGSGSRVILQEMADRDSFDQRPTRSALEQARWQASPAGKRQCEAALRHWEKVLRRVPARRYPARTATPYPRYWQAKSHSPATDLAARVISARTGVEVASVLLAVFAVALARVTGINPVVVVLVVNNRFRPGLARTVSPIIHPGLCVLDLPDGTVDQAVAHTRRRAITAYKYAYYDPPLREEMLERVNRERGEEVDLECTFNDRRLKPRDQSGPLPTAEQIRAAVARGSFEWTHQQDERAFDKLYVNVDDEPDTVQLTVVTDTHHLDPAAVKRCVRGMEEVAVAAALDPATVTSVPASGAGP